MAGTVVRWVAIESLPFSENTYIAHLEGSGDCVVVDPGLEPERILEHLDANQLTPAAILITHAHGDHIGGNRALKDRWPDCPIVAGTNEAPLLTDARRNMSASFGVSILSPPADCTVADGEVYSAAGMDFEVREIPGHSPGHVVFVWKGGQPFLVFGGDVLFAGSIGRTDLPGGSFENLARGIHRHLFALPDDTLVLPGHGEPTTVGKEKHTNPFVGAPAGRRRF